LFFHRFDFHSCEKRKRKKCHAVSSYSSRSFAWVACWLSLLLAITCRTEKKVARLNFAGTTVRPAFLDPTHLLPVVRKMDVTASHVNKLIFTIHNSSKSVTVNFRFWFIQMRHLFWVWWEFGPIYQ
jgi:hypothetical protein